ncbi:serine hydrolase [Streptomyces atratus]|uniref:serine hydrolase n=1 Tax=Streptomyces atratus TaxID=1893 RepID=UPI0037B4C1FC
MGGTSGSWYGTSGVADQRSGRTIRPGDRVRIGKAFFATVVLQLVHEHRVEPPTPVQLFLPGLLPAEYPDIRISHLLMHTSGLPSESGPDVIDTSTPELILAHRYDRRTPDRLLATVTRTKRLKSHSASSSLQVLWYLLTVPEHAAPMNQLSQLMGFSTARTTEVVDRLCEAGLLERRASCSDHRVTCAALTPVGLSATADASSALAAALRRRVAAAGVGTDRFAALAADIALLDPAPGPRTAGPGPDCPGV